MWLPVPLRVLPTGQHFHFKLSIVLCQTDHDLSQRLRCCCLLRRRRSSNGIFHYDHRRHHHHQKSSSSPIFFGVYATCLSICFWICAVYPENRTILSCKTCRKNLATVKNVLVPPPPAKIPVSVFFIMTKPTTNRPTELKIQYFLLVFATLEFLLNKVSC